EFYQVEPHGSQERSTRGMGLGLATVQRLVTLLGASVTLTSQPRHGTCVRVQVRATAPAPIRLAVPAALPGTRSADEPDLSGLRVLVIDDEATILEGLEVVLTNWGVE